MLISASHPASRPRGRGARGRKVSALLARASHKDKPSALSVCVRTCAVCGRVFCASHPKRGLCSTLCKRIAHKAQMAAGDVRRRHKPERMAYLALARAVRQQVVESAAESVNPFVVFERDRWRCQVCGRKTVWARRGTRHANAPELDHRVPLSRGGEHSYANTQCACRACNRAKGNRTSAGQMPLWIKPSTPWGGAISGAGRLEATRHPPTHACSNGVPEAPPPTGEVER